MKARDWSYSSAKNGRPPEDFRQCEMGQYEKKVLKVQAESLSFQHPVFGFQRFHIATLGEVR